jgi:crotonobetainyl-CoA:carnitine CoA-transferase CaiB-like acyl-CoA transferase
MLALEGIKVVEMTVWAYGPAAGAILGDWGADVIKIEDPGGGDPMRGIEMIGGVSAPKKYSMFDVDNRNKRSIAIDLKKREGREVVYKLINGADIFLTNYRAVALERLGMDYLTLAKINPRLIYAYCSGYGDEGPDKDRPGFDGSAYWARGGFMLQLRVEGTPPVAQGGAGLGDQPSGALAAGGIALALFVRERTGIGQKVSLSLLHSALWTVSLNVQAAMEYGTERFRTRREAVVNPLTNHYQTKDGKWIQLIMLQSERFWPKFCNVAGLKRLEHDPKFDSMLARASNREELISILDEVFATKTRDEWAQVFNGTSIIWDPANTFVDLTDDPQVLASGCFVPFEHPSKGPIKVIASPIQLSKTPATVRTAAPEFGQHTEEILLELDYTWEDIAKFREQGIIA